MTELSANLFTGVVMGVAADVIKTLEQIQDKDMLNIKHDGHCAIHCGAVMGQTTCVQALLEDGRCDVNAFSDGGFTSLMLATKNNHAGVVLALSEYEDTDVNATVRDMKNVTALHIAIRFRAYESALILIRNPRTDMHILDMDGRTPLQVAQRAIKDLEGTQAQEMADIIQACLYRIGECDAGKHEH